jgi:hypothetical protein
MKSRGTAGGRAGGKLFLGGWRRIVRSRLQRPLAPTQYSTPVIEGLTLDRLVQVDAGAGPRLGAEPSTIALWVSIFARG